MKRNTRNLVAAVLTAAVVFGVTAPAATAAPKVKPAHAGTASAAGVKGQAAKQRQLLRLIDGSDARLARVVEGKLLAGLAQDVVDVVTSNVATDREALAAIRATVVAGGQDLQLLQQVRSFRPETYAVVVGVVREAEQVAGEAAANDLALAAYDPADPAVVDAQATNDAAAAAAQDAVARALLLTATSPVQDRALVEAALEMAWELLAQVAVFLATPAPAAEPAA